MTVWVAPVFQNVCEGLSPAPIDSFTGCGVARGARAVPMNLLTSTWNFCCVPGFVLGAEDSGASQTLSI